MDIKEFQEKIAKDYKDANITMLFYSIMNRAGLMAGILNNGLNSGRIFIGKPLEGNVDCPSDNEMYFVGQQNKDYLILNIHSILALTCELLNKMDVSIDELV